MDAYERAAVAAHRAAQQAAIEQVIAEHDIVLSEPLQRAVLERGAAMDEWPLARALRTSLLDPR